MCPSEVLASKWRSESSMKHITLVTFAVGYLLLYSTYIHSIALLNLFPAASYSSSFFCVLVSLCASHWARVVQQNAIPQHQPRKFSSSVIRLASAFESDLHFLLHVKGNDYLRLKSRDCSMLGFSTCPHRNLVRLAQDNVWPSRSPRSLHPQHALVEWKPG